MESDEVGLCIAGKYNVLRRLAIGGMAEIFLAETSQIHGFRKKVVIKRILPHYANDSHYVDMFLDEARLMAHMTHPSIVQVFDIGEDDSGVFFTMEYVEGHDLAHLLGQCYKQKRNLSIDEVLSIAVPMAEALHHAHELRDENNELIRVVHRDVSPSNVLITREGRIKLLDFGIAKSEQQQRITTGVSLKGKFGYMAPEQCNGLELDRRADIFSYGVVLWELLTGRRLFAGGNAPYVLFKIINDDYALPQTLRPDVPKELSAICQRALEKDREKRYQSLQELLDDLHSFLKTSNTITTSDSLASLLETVFSPDAKLVSATRWYSVESSLNGKVIELQPKASPESTEFTESSTPSLSELELMDEPEAEHPYSSEEPSISLDPFVEEDSEFLYSSPPANRKWLAIPALLLIAIAWVVFRSPESTSSPTRDQPPKAVAKPVPDSPLTPKPTTEAPPEVRPEVKEVIVDLPVPESPPLKAEDKPSHPPVKSKPKKRKRNTISPKKTREPKPKPSKWDSNSPFAPE